MVDITTSWGLQTNKTSLASLGGHHLVCIVFFLDPNQYEWEIFLTNGCFHDDGYMYYGHWILDQWAMIIHLTGINGHHGSFTPSFDHGIFTSKWIRRLWIFVKRPLKIVRFRRIYCSWPLDVHFRWKNTCINYITILYPFVYGIVPSIIHYWD